MRWRGTERDLVPFGSEGVEPGIGWGFRGMLSDGEALWRLNEFGLLRYRSQASNACAGLTLQAASGPRSDASRPRDMRERD